VIIAQKAREANRQPPRDMRRNARGKLPVLVYFHGGGYVFGTFARAASAFAGELPAVVRPLRRLPPRARAPPPRGPRRRGGRAPCPGSAPGPWRGGTPGSPSRPTSAVSSSPGTRPAGTSSTTSPSASSRAISPVRVAGHVMFCPPAGWRGGPPRQAVRVRRVGDGSANSS
jgi:hypothetical protein